jgi:hypothetical protein
MTGMSIGTLFTLFIVPTFYTYIARDRRRPLATVPPPQVHGEPRLAETAEAHPL